MHVLCSALAVVAMVALTAACGNATPAPGAVTFNKDIAPIVFPNCASCHRPGGVAPFSLLTYAEAAEHADAIAKATREGHMPPWLPAPGQYPIVGDRRLRPEQVAVIQRWVKEGAPEGHAADRPATPIFPDGWEQGTPDLILTTDKPFDIRVGADDVYRNLVFRTPITEGVFVRAVELKTNNTRVHHAVIRVDRTSASRRRAGADGQPGFDGMALSVLDPDGQFIGWTPGRGPIVSPATMPWRLERGADVVVELHVIKSDKASTLQPTIGLFLTSTPPVQRPVTVRLESQVIDIPAGQSDYLVTDTYELPVAVDLLGVYPHAHFLGKEVRAFATLPDGSVKSLLHIEDWDFHWQQEYRYVSPIPLPRGTKVSMRFTFDNSSANKHNPNIPPKRVQGGSRSTDEMAKLGLQLLTQSPADAVRLVQEFDRRYKQAEVALGEIRVRAEPTNVDYLGLLGGAYVEVERFAEGAARLDAAVRLGDRTASTRNYLGAAMMAQGQTAAAVEHFRQAAALAPRDEVMHFNLGTALGALNRTAEAEAAFRRSITVNPDYGDAHVNLAALLLAGGRTKEAIPHFERAVALNPESAGMHSNLGGALASAGRYSEAMVEVRRALDLDPNHGPALDNLRRLQRIGIR
ncbi:MAG: tetratricopeptide repeat protein [Acidobacteria bacterium]|nr:tetratricopeptide repeat protein [Acidobacteriota bacterium]